jgi:hypothetical protein
MRQRFDSNADWNGANNLQFLPMMPREFYCAAAGQVPPGTEQDTFFQYFTGPNTLFPDPLQKVGIRDIPDGMSNTLFVAQAERAVPWTKAEDMAVAPDLPLPLPTRHFLVLMADATVRNVNRALVADATLRMFIDPRDGQAVQPGMLD